MSDSRQRIAWAFLVTLILATFIVLGTTVQDYLEIQMIQQRDVNYFGMILWPSIWWYGWVLIVPFAFEFAWRNRLESGEMGARIARVVVGGVVVFMAHMLLELAAMVTPFYADVHDSFADMLEYHFLGGLYLNVFIYIVIVATAHVARAYAEANERALQAAQLEAELSAVRLEALQTQLHPHFLFNALNGISALIRSQPATAERMLSRLSALLRKALDRSRMHTSTLGDEMAFLKEYLALEQLRFGETIRFEMNIEHGLDGHLVPIFVFQPLVENAIKHGLEKGSRVGTIRIDASRKEDKLQLVVCDDGIGMRGDHDLVTSGVGLSNLQGRLERLYHNDFGMTFEDAREGGLCVVIHIPVQG